MQFINKHLIQRYVQFKAFHNGLVSLPVIMVSYSDIYLHDIVIFHHMDYYLFIPLALIKYTEGLYGLLHLHFV